MQIKKFKADDMAQAFKLVKQEFGSEAVILSARSLKKERGVLGFLAKPGVEVTAATDAHYPRNRKALSIESGETQSEHRPFEYRMNDLSNKKRGFINSIHGGVKALKDRYKPAVRENDVPQRMPEELLTLRRHLFSQEIQENIAMELIEEMNGSLSSKETLEKEEIKSCFIRIIKEMGIKAGSLDNDTRGRKIMAFVGPPGVGKTTTIAKLAAFHTFKMKKRVALITLDNHRIGGIEQLKIYARIIGIPIEVASDNRELKKALKRQKNKEIILIDTAGISQKDGNRFDELKTLFDKIRHIEIQLLLDATTKEKDLVLILESFKKIPVSGLILTKLDESSAYGNIFNQLIRRRIPVSYFTNGQQVPGDIEIATLERLVDLIIGNEKDGEIVKGIPQTKRYSKEIRKISERDFIKSNERSLNGEKKEINASDRHFSEFYVANKNSDIFHYPDCKWANKIKHENLIVFECVSDAVNKDYKPCRLCKPEKCEERNTIPKAGQIKRVGSYGY